MTSTAASPSALNYSYLPRKAVLHSESQLKRFVVKGSRPTTVEFDLEYAENTSTLRSSLKRSVQTLSKYTTRVKNPPMKQTLMRKNIAKNIRELKVTPEKAAKNITQITGRFYRLQHLTIQDDRNSFTPIRIKKRIYPMRFLQSFVYDHEFCKEFMKCARYAKSLRIRKTSLDFNHLKRLQRLQNLYVILNTKYVSLPQEDRKYINELGQTLLGLKSVNNVVLEEEIDHESQTSLFTGLTEMLKGKAKVHLVADFVDVSHQKSKEKTVEKYLNSINEVGITNLKVNYAGVVKTNSKFGRCFYAPVHVRKDLYNRFLKALMNTSFEKVNYWPSFHTSYMDKELKDTFNQMMKPTSNVTVPGVSMIYHLDLLEYSNMNMMLDLYNAEVPKYDITITSTTTTFRKNLIENLEQHYLNVLSKVQKFGCEFSLNINARNLATMTELIDMLMPMVNLSLVKSLNLSVVDPLTTQNVRTLFKKLKKSCIYNVLRELEVDVSQREAISARELFELLDPLALSCPKLTKLLFSYHNSEDCQNIVEHAFKLLQKRHCRINFDYEVNRERGNLD